LRAARVVSKYMQLVEHDSSDVPQQVSTGTLPPCDKRVERFWSADQDIAVLLLVLRRAPTNREISSKLCRESPMEVINQRARRCNVENHGLTGPALSRTKI